MRQNPYITTALLGHSCLRVDITDFEETGKISLDLMTLLLNYIYNRDMYAHMPTYPEFKIATSKEMNGSFKLEENLNTSL